jgi:hypothetical protein
MTKNHGFNGSILTYSLPNEAVVLDIATLPANIVQKALEFAIPTLLRNATAGLLTEDPVKATERVKARIAAWAEGKWSAKGEASAEPRTSLLARAIAEVLGITPTEAAAKVEAAVEAALSAAEVDADSADEEEVALAKTTANSVRRAFRETEEVAPVYARLKAETAKKAAEGKTRVSLATLVG